MNYKITTERIDMQIEIWLPIIGYENLYEVSNTGRIKTMQKHGCAGKGNYSRSPLIRKQHIQKTHHNTNYFQVGLSLCGKIKKFYVHRLVAEAFIPNPLKKPYVNHINGDGLDNRCCNLEWVTNQENQIHANDVLQNGCLRKKPVLAISKSGKMLRFNSVSMAAKWLLATGKTKDLFCASGISKCCNKHIKSYMGFDWIFCNEI